MKVGKNIVGSFSYKEDKEDIIRELNVIAAREGKHRSEIIVSLIEEYVKSHGSGNPSFKLDQWQEDPEFQAVPTVFASSEMWTKYIDSCDKKDKLKLLKYVSFIKKNVDARI